MKGTVFPRPHIVDPKTGAKRPVKGSTWMSVGVLHPGSAGSGGSGDGDRCTPRCRLWMSAW